MSPRFTTNLLLATTGVCLLTAALTFRSAAVGWIALGAGALALSIVAVGFAMLDRGAGQRRIDALAAVVAVVTVVQARVFDDTVLRWGSFGLGCALAGLAALGLVLHEVDRQRRLEAAVAAARPRASENGRGPRSSVPSPEVTA